MAVCLITINNKMASPYGNEQQAVNCLKEISNQGLDEDWHLKKTVKRCKKTQRNRHGGSCDQTSLKMAKLPFIPTKQNINENHPCFVASNNRVNSYVLFQKGLGSYGTVNFKRSKALKNYNQKSKFIKLYSQSSQQEIELIKQWLTLKKESCRSYNQIFFKKKNAENREESFLKISIKNIL